MMHVDLLLNRNQALLARVISRILRLHHRQVDIRSRSLSVSTVSIYLREWINEAG